MKITRGFDGGATRYKFDSGACSVRKGWAQVDTGQDASYYGTWANPHTLTVFSYTEGDTCTSQADDAAEFVAELRLIKAWNEKHGWGFLGIDPGLGQDIARAFRDMGAADLLH